MAADAAAVVVRLPDAQHPPPPDGVVVDVHLDGRRTWSVRVMPAHAVAEGHRLAWPAELGRRLRGTALLEVRLAAGGVPGGAPEGAEAPEPGEPGGAVRVRFDDAPGGPDLVDETGRHQSVNKWGRLGPSFDGRDPAVRERVLDAVEDLVTLGRERLGIAPFVTYGTLLGAVRSGDLLPHDDDADLAYLSRADNPADVVLESYRHERELRAAGHEVVRHSGGHLQVVYRDGPDASVDFYVDLFTCFVAAGHFHQAFAVRVPAADVRIEPLTTVQLAGRTLPAPADPRSLLAAMYGPGWEVPDPAFRFTTPAATRRRLDNWLGTLNGARDDWNAFYAAPDPRLRDPSPFATAVAPRIPDGSVVLDVGAGDGRDTVLLAARHRVLAVDNAEAGLRLLRARVAAAGLEDAVEVLPVNVHDGRAVLDLAVEVRRRHGAADVYARFLLHAVQWEGVEHVLMLARAVLGAGNSAWLEFRTTPDAQRPHLFDRSLRRFLDADATVELAARHGLVVTERTDGQGLAVLDDEDPDVTRLRLQPAVPGRSAGTENEEAT